MGVASSMPSDKLLSLQASLREQTLFNFLIFESKVVTMARLVFILISLFLSLTTVKAQKSCVVASAEDHVPIREALIHTDNNHWARTDYRGYFTMKYQFDSATVSKPGYLKTTIYLKTLPDTLFLLPESRQLGEVEVWGKDQQHVREMEQGIQDKINENPPLSNSSGVSFDLAKMMDKRGRRDAKHLKTARKIIGELGRPDPLEEAFKKATGDKTLLKPKDE